jgi:4-amino-4-deoxy-L-arabinose transferase-like glycosyltransferase
MKKLSLTLLFSLVLGTFLRLDHFKLASFWGDEAVSANVLQRQDIGSLWAWTFCAGNNPGFTFLMKLWSLPFGDSEASLRFLSIIFSLLSVLMIYFLAKDLFNKSVASWSSFLLATSTISIFFSHQARPYSLIIFLSILSSWYLIKLLQNNWRKKELIIYFLIMLYVLYTHLWFFFLMAAHFLIVLIYKKELIKKMSIGYASLMAFSLPLFAEMLTLILCGSNSWIKKANLTNFYQTFFYYTEKMAVIYLLIIVLAIFFIIKKKREKKEKSKQKKELIIISILFFVPLSLGFTISLFAPMYAPGRHELLTLPFFIIIMAYFASKTKNKIIIFLIIAAISLSAIKVTRDERNNIKNYTTDEKRAAIFLTENIKDGDIIILQNLNKNTFSYYLPRLTNKEYIQINFPDYKGLDDKMEPLAIKRLNLFNKNEWKKNINIIINKKYEEKYHKENQETENYIRQTIKENRDADVWLVYDSQTEENQNIVALLNKELNLIKQNKFVKTEKMDKINWQFPMFFDYINQYERRD